LEVDGDLHPPRNLFLGLTDTNNYWAGYCESIMGQLDTVDCWAVGGEPNTAWGVHDPAAPAV
jgi:hypothetical protein